MLGLCNKTVSILKNMAVANFRHAVRENMFLKHFLGLLKYSRHCKNVFQSRIRNRGERHQEQLQIDLPYTGFLRQNKWNWESSVNGSNVRFFVYYTWDVHIKGGFECIATAREKRILRNLESQCLKERTRAHDDYKL